MGAGHGVTDRGGQRTNEHAPSLCILGAVLRAMLLPLALAKGDVLPSFLAHPPLSPKTLPCAPSPPAQEWDLAQLVWLGLLAFGPDTLRLATSPGLLATRRQALSKQRAASQFQWGDRVGTGSLCAHFPLGNQPAFEVSW